MIFIHDFSIFTVTYHMKSKTELLDKFKICVALMEKIKMNFKLCVPTIGENKYEQDVNNSVQSRH